MVVLEALKGAQVRSAYPWRCPVISKVVQLVVETHQETYDASQVELQCTSCGWERVRCFARLSLIFASELAGIASTAPFGMPPFPSSCLHLLCTFRVNWRVAAAGLRAWRTYCSLPSGTGAGGARGRHVHSDAVHIVRDIRHVSPSAALVGCLHVLT